jgi:hypothetical protein
VVEYATMLHDEAQATGIVCSSGEHARRDPTSNKYALVDEGGLVTDVARHPVSLDIRWVGRSGMLSRPQRRG